MFTGFYVLTQHIAIIILDSSFLANVGSNSGVQDDVVFQRIPVRIQTAKDQDPAPIMDFLRESLKAWA